MKTVYEYNKANLPTLVKNTNSAGSTIHSSFGYTYYADGNQASKTDKNGKVTSYTYNKFGRLVDENAPSFKYGYAYDVYGNRVAKTTTHKGYDYEWERYSYEYDANNRLTKESYYDVYDTVYVSEYDYPYDKENISLKSNNISWKYVIYI